MGYVWGTGLNNNNKCLGWYWGILKRFVEYVKRFELIGLFTYG